MLPKIAVLFTSYRCDCRCIMCSAWIRQKDYPELSLQQIERIFTDRLLRRNIEIINLTGGEPTIREDMADIVKIFINNCDRLRRIDIPTNGINTDQVVDKIERVLAILLPTTIRLTVTISLDGVGEVHERVRGVSNIFAKIDKTIEELKELMLLYPSFSLGLNMTINKMNYYVIEEVKEYVARKGIGINFTLAAISDIGVESSMLRANFEMGQDEKDKVALSLENLLQTDTLNPRYVKFMLSWLKTERRNKGCVFKQSKAFLLEPNGEVYMCGNFKEFRIGNVLDKPFEIIWKQAGKVLKDTPNKCISCSSNCYLDEILIP